VALEIESVGGQPPAPQAGGLEIESIGQAPLQIESVNGVPADGKKKGFWSEFGETTGGLKGLAMAPLTSSIPAEMFKGASRRSITENVMDPLGVGMIAKRIDDFLTSPDSKDLPGQAVQAYRDTVKFGKEHPGSLVGGITKGVVADPELFFVPGLTEAKGGELAVGAAKAAGASERAAAIAGKVGEKAAATSTGAAIGSGAEVSREIGEDEPTNIGAIAGGAAIGAVLGGVTQITGKGAKVRAMTPEEIEAQIRPAMATPGATPEVHIEPSADGFVVRVAGEAENAPFETREQAEAHAQHLRETAAGYRAMDTVPRGTETPEGQRARMMHENPFTPENMAKWVKPAGISAEKAGGTLVSYWTKTAVAAGVGAAAGAYLDPDDPGTSAAFGAGISVLPRALGRDKRISVEKVINERNGQIAVMARHTLQFKAAIDAQVPEALRRNAISLAMEGHPGIKLNPAEQGVARSVRDFFNAMGETAIDAGVMKELLHNYVSHIVVEDPAAKAAGTIDKLIDILTGKKDRPTDASGRQFARHRRYATFDELQTALRGSGLKIKTGDIGEIMAIYSKAMFRAVTDKRLLDALKVHPVEGMAPFIMRTSDWLQKTVMGKDRQIEREPLEGEARAADPKLEAPPGTDVAATGGEVATGSPGEPPEGGGFQLPPDPGPGESARRFAERGPRTLLMPSELGDSNYVQSNNRQLAGYVIHKDIAPQLNFVFHSRDPNDVTLGLMALNQASKRAIVSFSLFHAKSLTDAFIGAQGLGAFKNPKAQVQAALAMFRYGGDNGGIDHLLKGGLQLQIADDLARGGLEGALARTAEVLDKAVPVSGIGRAGAKGVETLSKFNDLLDHFTFRTLQGGFKLITGLDAYERLVKKGIPPERAGEMAASYANDIYGSLDWFRVANDVHSKIGRDIVYGFFNPNGRRWMQLMMFAPDWTISTFRAAYKALPGAVDDPGLAALHRRYLAKSAIYYLTVANGLNYALSGHSVFDNENPTRVQLKDGRTMQFSKHFMEPFEWLRDPIQTGDNKLAFLPRTLVEFGTGKEYISAHDSAPDLDARANLVAQQFLPINMQQGLLGGGPESALGLVGMPIYGKDSDQKREAKKERRIAAQKKKERAAHYFQRLHKGG
jgi:hypothetical protein